MTERSEIESSPSPRDQIADLLNSAPPYIEPDELRENHPIRRLRQGTKWRHIVHAGYTEDPTIGNYYAVNSKIHQGHFDLYSRSGKLSMANVSPTDLLPTLEDLKRYPVGLMTVENIYGMALGEKAYIVEKALNTFDLYGMDGQLIASSVTAPTFNELGFRQLPKSDPRANSA